MPARFVIRPDGMVVYAEASPDYTRRPDPIRIGSDARPPKVAGTAVTSEIR